MTPFRLGVFRLLSAHLLSPWRSGWFSSIPLVLLSFATLMSPLVYPLVVVKRRSTAENAPSSNPTTRLVSAGASVACSRAAGRAADPSRLEGSKKDVSARIRGFPQHTLGARRNLKREMQKMEVSASGLSLSVISGGRVKPTVTLGGRRGHPTGLSGKGFGVENSHSQRSGKRGPLQTGERWGDD